MSTQTVVLPINNSYSDFFSLGIEYGKKTTCISLQALTGIAHTSSVADTVSILKTYLPSVLASECFNDKNLPFSEEVKDTELGHLFEHILLEYLCELKMAKGTENVEFSGTTSWNWKKEMFGTFHIVISCGKEDRDIIYLAIEQTAKLVNSILQSSYSDEVRADSLYAPSRSVSQKYKQMTV